MDYNEIDYTKCPSLESVANHSEEELPCFDFLGTNTYLATFFQGMKILDAFYWQAKPERRAEDDEYCQLEFLLVDQKGYLWTLLISATDSDRKVKVTLSQALDH